MPEYKTKYTKLKAEFKERYWTRQNTKYQTQCEGPYHGSEHLDNSYF